MISGVSRQLKSFGNVMLITSESIYIKVGVTFRYKFKLTCSSLRNKVSEKKVSETLLLTPEQNVREQSLGNILGVS